jgi:hypothetical protein
MSRQGNRSGMLNQGPLPALFHGVIEYAAGDSLSTSVTIDSVKSAGGHTMLTTRSDISTTEGEHVVTAFSTLVIRGAEG